MRRLADADRIRRFMDALRDRADVPADVYFTGGATAVLMGWRPSTIDIDLKWAPERDEIFRALPDLKEQLQINLEIAAPPDFIPELPGWQERCLFIAAVGRLRFKHYDLHSQALAKIERGHRQDRQDVANMLGHQLVEPAELRRLFEAIVPRLYRYPAIDPAAFRRSLDETLAAGPDARA